MIIQCLLQYFVRPEHVHAGTIFANQAPAPGFYMNRSQLQLPPGAVRQTMDGRGIPQCGERLLHLYRCRMACKYSWN